MNKINYDFISEIYDDIREEEEIIIEAFLRGARLEDSSVVLDIGCGTGSYANLIQRMTHSKVYGIDISEKMIEKGIQKNKNVVFQIGSATKIPFADNFFDYIYMTDVIHHVSDIDAMFLEIYRTLKIGGRICIDTQSHRQIENRYIGEYFPTTIEIDKKRYSDIELIKKSAEKKGLKFSKEEVVGENISVELGDKFIEVIKNKGFSELHLISDEEYQNGFHRIKSEVEKGSVIRQAAGSTIIWFLKKGRSNYYKTYDGKNITKGDWISTVDWKPDKASKIPIYRQILDYISEKISTGQWVIGSKLPSQRELAKIFEVNRSTIVEALDELKSRGLIEGEFSRGTRIINNRWSLTDSTSAINWHNYILAGTHKPNIPTVQIINKLEHIEGIIPLSSGEINPELFSQESMRKVFEKVSNKRIYLNHEDPKGLMELRQVLSEYLKEYGINVSPACILVTGGSLQALQLIIMGILHSGCNIFLEDLSYLKSLNIFQSAGIKLKGIGMDDNGVRPKEILKKKVNHGGDILYTNPTFQNPTGVIATKERRIELLETCIKQRLPIIEDDSYRELWLDEKPPMPIKSMDNQGNVIYLGSISKFLWKGSKISWLVGPEPIIERLSDIKMQAGYEISSIAGCELTELIQSGLYDEHISEVREKIKARRKFTLEVLKSYYYDIAQWNIPKGGVYIWLRLNKKISTDQLFYRALKEGILLTPGNIYGFTQNQCIRISYSYVLLEELEKGLIRLSKIIRELNKTSYIH